MFFFDNKNVRFDKFNLMFEECLFSLINLIELLLSVINQDVGEGKEEGRPFFSDNRFSLFLQIVY